MRDLRRKSVILTAENEKMNDQNDFLCYGRAQEVFCKKVIIFCHNSVTQ